MCWKFKNKVCYGGEGFDDQVEKEARKRDQYVRDFRDGRTGMGDAVFTRFLPRFLQ